jgi:hypothetical protein
MSTLPNPTIDLVIPVNVATTNKKHWLLRYQLLQVYLRGFLPPAT